MRRAALLFALALCACSGASSPPGPSPAASGASPALTASAQVAPAGVSAAQVGSPAPDFTLKDLDGKEVKLSSFRGKRVVLEWFNPECPFSRASHARGSLKGYAEAVAAKGVVWLAVNSGAPGKQGHAVEKNRTALERFGMRHALLRDEDGAVGHRYGAAHTPHLFVIDEKGVLVYAGAIDNSPDAIGESPEGDKLVNYVTEALAALEAGRPVAIPRTEAYGCSVKY